MMDIGRVVEKLDAARRGLNEARDVVGDWERGTIAGVDMTVKQRAALKTAFETGLQKGKDGIAAVDVELLN